MDVGKPFLYPQKMKFILLLLDNTTAIIHFPFTQTKQQYMVGNGFINCQFLALRDTYKLVERLGN